MIQAVEEKEKEKEKQSSGIHAAQFQNGSLYGMHERFMGSPRTWKTKAARVRQGNLFAMRVLKSIYIVRRQLWRLRVMKARSVRPLSAVQVYMHA